MKTDQRAADVADVHRLVVRHLEVGDISVELLLPRLIRPGRLKAGPFVNQAPAYIATWFHVCVGEAPVRETSIQAAAAA